MEKEASIQLSAEDRARLEGWVAGRNTPQKLVWRARIILLWAQGAGVAATVRAIGKTKRTVYRWRERYVARGAAGLERDATRPGRKPPLSAAAIERVVNMTLHEKPPASTHWSARKLAKAVAASCAPSTATGPNRSICIWSSTTTPPTSTPRSRPGSSATLASTSTSRRLPPPGSIWSSVSSA